MPGLNGMHANPPSHYAQAQQQAAQPVQQHQTTMSVTSDQPLVTITPPVVRITTAQVWATIIAIPATIAYLGSLGIFYVPAKQTELHDLVAVVQVVKQAQEDSNAALRRLTEAVDNLSGLVVKLPKPKNLTGAVKLR